MNWLKRFLGIDTAAQQEQPSQKPKREITAASRPDPVLHRAQPPKPHYTHPRSEPKRRESDTASNPNSLAYPLNPLSPLSPMWIGASTDNNDRDRSTHDASSPYSRHDNDTPSYGGGGGSSYGGSSYNDSGSSSSSDGGGGGGGGDISCDPALDHIRHRAFRI